MEINGINSRMEWEGLANFAENVSSTEVETDAASMEVETDIAPMEVEEEKKADITGSAMRRWETLFYKSLELVRDVKSKTGRVNQHLVKRMLEDFYDKQISDNDIRMVAVLALAALGSHYRVQAAGLPDGHASKQAIQGRIEAVSWLSNFIENYANANRTFNERRQQEIQHKLNEIDKILAAIAATGDTHLASVATNIENQKANENAARQ